MAEELTFSIGPDDEITVHSYDELQKWLEKERAEWAWLVRGDTKTDRHNTAANIQNHWDGIVTQVQNMKDAGHPLKNVLPYLAPLSVGPLLVSTSIDGSTVLDIRSSAGEEVAAFAAGFMKAQIGMQQAQNKNDMLAAVLTIFPDLMSTADWHERLKTERKNFKMATRSLIERVDKEANERNAKQVELVKRGSGIAKRLFDQKRERWRNVQANWQDGASSAVADIRATEAAYKEYMKLKAPVEYWNSKASDHEVREDKARTRLYWFFPVTLAVMAIAFGWVANFLIIHPDTETTKAPIALYVVVSGGLLLLSTIAFWIGRILTKLYLSEHHLRNDAEERAVMTTTYLALTTEEAATDTDRHIVLSALFRATPDGIVKDDGPSDTSLQGLIARMVTNNRV